MTNRRERDGHPGHGDAARAPAGRDAAVRAVAQAVIEGRTAEWVRGAVSKAEGQALMSEIVGQVLASEAPASAWEGRTAAEKALARDLIDLVRKELLEDGRGLAGADLVSTLCDLETVRHRAEARGNRNLSTQLTGAGALDLVVEVAHDLRSPLTSIMFLSETLRRGQSGEINDVQRQQLGIIYSAALGLVSVANDLMDMARGDQTDRPDDQLPEPFSLTESLGAVRSMVRPMLEEKRLDLRFITPDADIREGKAVPLGRVLLNLVTNAIKFTDEGFIEIIARETHGCRVEFSVRDTGRGMDPEAVESLYQMFQRSHSQTGFRFSDTGLGLSLCRRMVALMGGELHVESSVGKGTTFSFEIELPRSLRASRTAGVV